jgi:hypothetical protein
MLSLKPERSAIMRINPGGRSHVDFLTVGADGTLVEGWLGGMETSPVARTVSVMITAIATPAVRSFHGWIIIYARWEHAFELMEPDWLDTSFILKDRFAVFV